MTSWTQNEKVRFAPVQNFDVVEGQDHENVCVDSAHAPGSKTVRIAPARVLDPEKRSDLGRSGHVRKVGNCVPCAAGCGRMRSHFRLDPTTRLGGCLSVHKSQPHVPGIWVAPDDSQFIVTREARYFLVAHYQTYTPAEVNTILSREQEAVELTDQAPDIDHHVRRSRWKVISFGTKTSLMNLKIIRLELSGSLHIRWPARRQLRC